MMAAEDTMGFRFRRTIKLAPGVRLNISKSGVSTSIGTRGATINVGRRGTRGTVGIPGTGISYSERLDSSPATGAKPKRAIGSPTFVLLVILLLGVLAFLAIH